MARPGVGKSHFARQVLVAEGYYPKLNNKWWDGYQARRSSSWRTLMRKRLSSFTTTLRFGVLGEAQWFLGFGRGFGGGRPFFRTSLPPLEQRPQSVRGADPKRAILLVAARVSSRKFPPKFKLSTWAIWSAFTAKISNSSTKQMCGSLDLARSRSRQEPLCPSSAGSRGLLP